MSTGIGKSLGAKICVLADCDAHLAIVNYSLPSIHREPQKEVYKKLVKDKDGNLPGSTKSKGRWTRYKIPLALLV